MGGDDDLDRLERLRARKRTDLKEGLVQAVMVQPLGIGEKIRKIELIDLLADEEPAPVPGRPPRGPLVRPPAPRAEDPELPGPPGPPPLVDPGLPEKDRVEHHRRHLGRPPERTGLWAYLTREFPRLASEGVASGCLAAGWVPFQLKLSPGVETYLKTTLRAQILPVLGQALPVLRKTSWMVLTKAEYNLLAALGDLVEALRAVPVPGSPRGWRPWWEAYAPVLPALALFWTGDGLAAQTLRAWDLAALKVGLPEKTRSGGRESVRSLLEPGSPSLVQAVEALLCLRARRLCGPPDLVPPGPGEYLIQDSFDAPPEVQAEIGRALAQLTGRMESLGREFLDLRRIRYFVPDGALLEEFTRGFDRSDRSLWTRHFLPLLRDAVGPLVAGTVQFAGGYRAELFHSPALAAVAVRLGELQEALDNPLTGSDPGLAGDVARVTVNLGKSLAVLILQRSRAADPLVSAPADPADPLEFEEEILDQPAEWAGMRVIDALVRAARVALLAGRFLGDTSLDGPLGKEESLKTQADEILARIERMGSRAQAEEQKAAWLQARGA